MARDGFTPGCTDDASATFGHREGLGRLQKLPDRLIAGMREDDDPDHRVVCAGE